MKEEEALKEKGDFRYENLVILENFLALAWL